MSAYDYSDDDYEAEMLEQLQQVSSMLTPRSSIVSAGQRRVSRASFNFFQQETAFESEGGLIGRDGKVRDEYIVKRQSVNKPAILKQIPLLADLTTDIETVDGWVLTQLLVSGFAKMSTKIDELNKINVFPIADGTPPRAILLATWTVVLSPYSRSLVMHQHIHHSSHASTSFFVGDTGVNMKICLKLPTRNLVLDPSDSILTVASNFAADVLLNGQGNSGTILSHFFVSLAQAIKDTGKEQLSIDEFASCLVISGAKMADAVPNPVEGTLLSVSRDACHGLKEDGSFATLKDLLEAWNTRAQTELAKTPEQLIVDGVKVLEKAGVVDSGAQGFVYVVEGMFLASNGELPEASDPALFKTATIASEEAAGLKVDHTVTDSKFQFCTEAVVVLKDGVDENAVLECITSSELGDSIASVTAPSKDGGIMVKIHIHTNNPEAVFERIRPFSKDPLLKKEKVEDMYTMREHMHGESTRDLSNAKFTIMGLGSMVLPPLEQSEEIFTLPVFMVPETTQEPIDLRFATDSETCAALNMQRHKSTAIRYTTAASNPMQLKIELLSALSKGKPIMVFLMSKDKRVSALGRNVTAAIDMLSPEQQVKISVLVHGWGFHEALLLLEAMKLAQEGKTVEEAYSVCSGIAARNFMFASFVSSPTVRKLLAWRPGLFPPGFSVEDGQFVSFGVPVVIREGEPLPESERVGMIMTVQGRAPSLSELQDAEVRRLRDALEPGQRIASLLVPCVGRTDFGHMFVNKLKAAGVSARMLVICLWMVLLLITYLFVLFCPCRFRLKEILSFTTWASSQLPRQVGAK
jgi:hypothetical protein